MSKLRLQFFGVWAISLLVSLVIIYAYLFWKAPNISTAFNASLQIIGIKLLFFAQWPALGFLWHSDKENLSEKHDRGDLESAIMLGTVHGIFIGIMAIIFTQN